MAVLTPIAYITQRSLRDLQRRVITRSPVFATDDGASVALYTEEQVEAMIQAEREACAELCDMSDSCDPEYIAQAIRARGSDE